MPRDDLTIDFIGTRGKMVLHENHDPATVLEDWINRVANLPAEIAFMQEEIEQKDILMRDCLSTINKCDAQIQKWIRANGSLVPNPKEEALSRQVIENYDKAQILQEEKIALATKTKAIMDKHTRWIDGRIKGMVDRGDFSVDADFPSVLKPENNTIAAPAVLAPIINSASVPTRHPNQHPQRPFAAHLQTGVVTGSSSAPPTPASAVHPGRNARETSLGAANKRQKLIGNLPLQTSSLGRQASNAPGTPRGATPISSRAGSIGPRSSQAATKKVLPHGNKPGGTVRKHKKSGLSRVKGMRNKNSPSSTNDSELSDAESGSLDDEEAHTPAGNREGDEDIVDVDEEGGEGDDRVYCICQKVSFGDMVACDNEKCPYEWFHWNCVGLKSEPEGTWICPPCTKAGFRK